MILSFVFYYIFIISRSSYNIFVSILGEDMLQMALKMASEYEEPAVDLESAMTASTITPSSHPPMPNEEGVDDPNPMQHHHHMIMMEQQRAAMRGRKRPNRPPSNR